MSGEYSRDRERRHLNCQYSRSPAVCSCEDVDFVFISNQIEKAEQGEIDDILPLVSLEKHYQSLTSHSTLFSAFSVIWLHSESIIAERINLKLEFMWKWDGFVIWCHVHQFKRNTLSINQLPSLNHARIASNRNDKIHEFGHNNLQCVAKQ